MVARNRLQRVGGAKPKGILEQAMDGYRMEFPKVELPSLKNIPSLKDLPKDK